MDEPQRLMRKTKHTLLCGRQDIGRDDSENINSFAAKKARILKCVFAASMLMAHATWYFHSFDDAQRTKRDERYFVLHVGPGKTGTTTIQDSLGTSKLGKLLALDNYVYIGNNAGNLQRDKVQTKNVQTGRYEFSDAFLKQICGLQGKGRHIVGSNEFLAKMNGHQLLEWRNVFEAAAAKGASNHSTYDYDWKLVVAISYRRFHDMLPSLWNQHYKKKRDRLTGKILSLRHDDWPGVNGDYPIRSFRDHFEDEYGFHPRAGNHTTPKLLPQHPAQLAYETWKDVAEKIIFVNTHERHHARTHPISNTTTSPDSMPKVDLVGNFVCHALPGAHQTCSALRTPNATSVTTKSKASNPSVGLDSDILAVRAYETGLVAASHSRHSVAKAIDQHIQKNGLALPQDCLDQSALENLYQRSLEFEAWFFSMRHSNSHNHNHNEGIDQSVPTPSLTSEELSDFRADWDKSVAKEKFCSVDANAALASEEWQSFFRGKFSK